MRISEARTPFKAVLLACDNGHYEATTEDAYTPAKGRNHCEVCNRRLSVVKTVTIQPGPLQRVAP